MDKTLQSLYLRVDLTTKSLRKNAISQIIIKILYSCERRLSLNEINNEYKKTIGHGKPDDITVVLNELLLENSIKMISNSYYLSNSKRKKIDETYNESRLRKTRIIDKYFKPCLTSDETLNDWFIDTSIIFFNNYSSEWISDISYNNSNAVSNCKKSLLSLLEAKTSIDNRLEKCDRKELADKFVKFITSRDSDVDAHLWEFGTSAFTAKLIRTFDGADSLAIETFANSKCVFDTNVLMNIGLESSEYYSAFSSLEKVFEKLNISCGYLHITLEEYKRAIGIKQDEILKLVELYPFKVIRETDDLYIQTAIKRGCRNLIDFREFFSQVIDIPSVIENKVKIELFDNDNELENKITLAQVNEKKLIELNNIYKEITGRDKRQIPLKHDVGLIEGANYLRTKDKCFILSREISVNQYAKQSPSINNLPLSIRLETLINMLAVDNGGTEIDPLDYKSLFASIIKAGLIPNKDTFRIADLSRMLETENQITQLPPDDIINIAKGVNRNRALGLDDEKIRLELVREIQGSKLKIAEELDETKVLLVNETKEKNRYQSQADKSTNAFRRQIEKEENAKYDKELSNMKICYYVILPIFLLFVSGIIIYVLKTKIISESSEFTLIYVLGIVTDIIIFALTSFFLAIPKIRKMKKNKNTTIENNIANRITEELG